jgi:hypothetical protein
LSLPFVPPMLPSAVPIQLPADTDPLWENRD